METFYKTEKFARLQFRRENHLHATAKRSHGDQNIWVWRKTWMIGFESTCWWVGFEKYFAGIFFSEKRKFSFVFCFIIRVYNYFDMYCQRNFMLYVINYVIFLEIKIENSPFFYNRFSTQFNIHILIVRHITFVSIIFDIWKGILILIVKKP